MLTISSDFSWTLCVLNKEVNVGQLQLFRGVSSNLQSTEAIIRVVTLLDDSKFCVGNPDVSRHKGDHLGMFTVW